MNPARVMAKLTAQPARLDGGGGGMTEYDVALCASLAANLKERYYLAARLKWCQDWSVANKLEYLLWIEAVGIAAEEKWRVPKGREYVRKMAGLAIAEIAEPQRWKEQQTKAQFMGMDKSTWSRTWQGRYEVIYSELSGWCDTAYRHIARMQG